MAMQEATPVNNFRSLDVVSEQAEHHAQATSAGSFLDAPPGSAQPDLSRKLTICFEVFVDVHVVELQQQAEL